MLPTTIKKREGKIAPTRCPLFKRSDFTSYNRRNLSILVIFQQPEKCHNVVHDLEAFSDITEEIIDGNDDDDDVGGHIAENDDPIISIVFF